MRMTKYEQKQEVKESEGSPEIKGRMKALRRNMLKNSVAKTIPKADVIITNPTHYAIALNYDETKMRAPIVSAKGIDSLAQIIKELAVKNQIPIIENKPLARALYEVKVGKEIPIEHYMAVAEIISYVYKLKNKKRNIK